MRGFQETNVFLIAASFFAAIILSILPLPTWALWLRPQWTLAVLLFWVLASSEQCGVATAWVLGVLMDVMTGTPLGLHAFIFVILSYIMLQVRFVVVYFPVWHQAIVIGAFVFLNGLFQAVLMSWLGHAAHMGLHILPSITTTLIWPWLFSALDRLRPSVLIR